MHKVLVTGVAGFLGRHVADSCLKLGMDVVGLDDLSGGTLSNVPAGVRFKEGSITDDAFVRALTEFEGFDFIYHLAAYAAEGLSHFIRRYNYTTNVIGSATLINAAIRTNVQCFVFTSSIAVYGKSHVPVTEDTVPQPEDPYGVSKYAVELDLKTAHAMFGTNYIVFRPHNIYGPYQNIADKYRNVVGIFMNQMLCGEPMTIFGDGLQTRAFSYVGDSAPVIAAAPLCQDAYNDVFNIGADTPLTVLELAREVAHVLELPVRIRHLEPRHEVVHISANHSKVRQRFGIHDAPIELGAGLRDMAAWVKQTAIPSPTGLSEVELTLKLPPSWAPCVRNRT